MPLSFAAILGGMCTLIGTSVNLIVSGLASDLIVSPGNKTVGGNGTNASLPGMVATHLSMYAMYAMYAMSGAERYDVQLTIKVHSPPSLLLP